MSRKLRELTENQIKKAEAEGKLSGLEGEGKPLPHRPGDAFIEAGDAIGHRIMAEAGVLPEEITLKKALIEARKQYTTLTDPEERKATMAKIADLEMKHAMATDARRKFLKS